MLHGNLPQPQVGYGNVHPSLHLTVLTSFKSSPFTVPGRSTVGVAPPGSLSYALLLAVSGDIEIRENEQYRDKGQRGADEDALHNVRGNGSRMGYMEERP
jgi:hypothetical protein